jgi:hypothetical protein
LQACAPELRNKLSQPVPSTTIVGAISVYMIERYGFSPDCKVVAFTGDNHSSLAGLRMKPKDIGITLGTSDCSFIWIPVGEEGEEHTRPTPQLVGHVWPNPVEGEDYMALLWYVIRELHLLLLLLLLASQTWQLGRGEGGDDRRTELNQEVELMKPQIGKAAAEH